jgi:hypothetical protein
MNARKKVSQPMRTSSGATSSRLARRMENLSAFFATGKRRWRPAKWMISP